MMAVRRFFAKLRNFFHPGRAEDELAREVASHLTLLEDEFLGSGLSPEEARLAAKRTYGGVEQTKELQRDERSFLWLEQLRQDVRIAARTLWNAPGFSLVTILILALGTGANTAIFSLIDSLLLKTLPVFRPEQLLQVNLRGKDLWGRDNPFVSHPVWEQLRDRQDVFSGLFSYSIGRFNLATRGEARYIQGNYVSGQFFDTLGLRPIVGRTLTLADDRPGCPATVVLSYHFWQSEYGGRPEVIGQTLSLDQHRFLVLGVLGPGFTGVDVGRNSDLYIPLCADRVLHGTASALENGMAVWLHVMGRPKPGYSPAQVEARLRTLAGPVLAATLPPHLRLDQQETYRQRTFQVQPAAHGSSLVRTQYSRALAVLMVIVGLVLVITCVNLANLLLARSTARQREMAIRMALGCGRGRLLRQLVVECLLLSFTGTFLGMGLAQASARLLVGLLSTSVYQESQVFLDLSMDIRVLAFTTGIALLTGFLFGLAPAWRATSVDPQTALKANARGVVRGGTFEPGKILIVLQLALSLLLVTGAGLLLSTFFQLKTLSPGFDRQHVLLLRTSRRVEGDTAGERRLRWERILQELRAVPGVRSASYSDVTPLEGSINAGYIQTENGLARSQRPSLIYLNLVSNRFFATLGTRLLAGRDFSGKDTVGSPAVAIVNQSFARGFFPGRSPLGQHYRSVQGNQPGDPIEIVGVVQDAKYASLREEVPPTAYLPASQEIRTGSSITFEVRTVAGSPTALIPALRSALATVDPDLLVQYQSFAEQIDASLTRERLLTTLSSFFGGLALLLALLGLYGLLSYRMTRRRPEIGLRLALGAAPSDVLYGVLREGAVLIILGLLLGFLASLSATRWLASFLYGVQANDPRLLGSAAALLVSVALLANWIPARQASRLDPMTVLREE